MNIEGTKFIFILSKYTKYVNNILKDYFFNWKLLIKYNYIIDFSYLKQIIFLYEINIWLLGKSKNIPLSANIKYFSLGFNIKLILQ